MEKVKEQLSILVVEDNQGDFLLIKDYLEEQIDIPQIIHAKNYLEAKNVLGLPTAQFDVVLLDLSLPDKSGEILIKEIVDLCKEAPVIVLTGYADIEFSIKSLSLKVSDYLLKDEINASNLYKSIKYNIERKNSSAKLIESEKRYSNLFQLSPQPMLIYDVTDFRFFQVNEAAIKLYQYTEAEFLQKTLWDIFATDNTESLKEIADETFAADSSAYKGRFKHYKKSEEEIEVEIYSNVININNQLYHSSIIIDVTEKIQYEYKLTRAVIQTQEEERYEIGAELHDNVCQILATSQLSLEMLKNSMPENSTTWLDRSKEYINKALDEIRKISHRLAPAFFEEATLEDAINKLIENFNIHSHYQIHFDYHPQLRMEVFNRDIQINLYRILQEQLNNVQKYAKARVINIELAKTKSTLIMRITDNGVGFDVSKRINGIGITNMKRRSELFSGKLEISSSPGNGCELSVSIPLKKALA